MRFAGAVISVGLSLWVTAAAAEVLAVCAEPHAQPAGLSATLGITPARSGNDTQLALTRDAKGFDIVLNWGERGQQSLRADGADIMGDQLDDNFIHLVVARKDARSLEHFLFTLEDSKLGELLWSASDSADNDAETVTLASACVKPK